MKIEVIALENFPLVQENDNLCELILACMAENQVVLQKRDIIVIAQKIVSVVEKRTAYLNSFSGGEKAKTLSLQTGRSIEFCQAVIEESSEILGVNGRMIITKHKNGFICTNAGIDSSNAGKHDEGKIVLLPVDSDKSAANIRQAICQVAGFSVEHDLAVVITDSFGCEHRLGAIGMAIGAAGINALEKKRGKDLFDNEKNATTAVIDAVAGFANLLMGELNEQRPVVLIRGLNYIVNNNVSIKDILGE